MSRAAFTHKLMSWVRSRPAGPGARDLVRLECTADPPHEPLWTAATDMTRLCPPPCWQCLYEPVVTRYDRLLAHRETWLTDVATVLEEHGANLSDVVAIRDEERHRTHTRLRVPVPIDAIVSDFRTVAAHRACAIGHDDIDTVLILGHVDRGNALTVARALLDGEEADDREVPADALVTHRYATFYRPGAWETTGTYQPEWVVRWHAEPTADTTPVTTVGTEET